MSGHGAGAQTRIDFPGPYGIGERAWAAYRAEQERHQAQLHWCSLIARLVRRNGTRLLPPTEGTT